MMQVQLEKTEQQIPEFPNILPAMLFCFVLVTVVLCAPYRGNPQRDKLAK
jgi:hypothetical protein